MTTKPPTVFARCREESAHPELWDGLMIPRREESAYPNLRDGLVAGWDCRHGVEIRPRRNPASHASIGECLLALTVLITQQKTE